jgi:CHAT domain-containing protein/tetratricopeptide (TPR) repeat protein
MAWVQRINLFTVCALAVATAFASGALAEIPPFPPPKEPYTEEQRQWLAERAEERKQVTALADRQIAAAVQAGERMLVRDRHTFGNVHAETASGLDFLSGLHYRKADVTSFVKTREEVVEIAKALLGEKHWRIRELEYLRYRDAVLLHLQDLDRRTMNEILALISKAHQLHQAQKYQEGLEAARQAKAATETLFKKAAWKLPATQTHEYAQALRAEALNLHPLNQLDAAEQNWAAGAKIAWSLFGPGSLHYAAMQWGLGAIHVERQNWEQAERAYRTALDVYEVEDGGKGARLGQFLMHFGQVYSFRGEKSRAEAVCRRAVELLAAAGQQETVLYATALAAHGRALLGVGKATEGRAVIQQALAVTAKATGGQGFQYAQCLVDTAEAMSGSPETATDAMKLLNDAAVIYRSLGVEKQGAYAKLLQNRALLQRLAGAFPEAEASLVERSLIVGRSRFVVDDFIRLYREWIRSALKAQRLEEARDVNRKMEKIVAEQYGPTHDLTVTARLQTAAFEKALRFTPEQRKKDRTFELVEEGQAQFAAGKFDAALATLAAGAQLREELYGTDDVILAGIVGDLGMVSYKLGRRDEADRLFRRWSGMTKRLYPPESTPLSVGEACFRQAEMLVEQGEISRAIPLFQEARRVHRVRSGKTSAGYLFATDTTAFALIEVGEFERAETLLKESLAGHARTSGSNSPQYARSLRWMGRLQIRSGDPSGIKLVDQAENILRERIATTGVSFDLWALIVEKGEYLTETGNHKRAIPLLEWAENVLRSFPFARESVYVPRCLQCLGLAYFHAGQHDKAEKFVREALELMRTRALGLPGYRKELDLLTRLLTRKVVDAYSAGRMEDFIAAHRAVADAWSRYAGADHPVSRTRRNVVAAAERIGKLDEASKKRWDDALAECIRAVSMAGQQGKAAEAVEMADRAAAAVRDLLGQDTYYYIDALQSKAKVLGRAGKTNEASAAWNVVLSAAGPHLGPHCEIAGMAHWELGLLADDQAEKLRLYGRAADVFGRALGTGSSMYGLALSQRGLFELHSGDFRGAGTTLREALAVLSPLQRELPVAYLSCLETCTDVALALRDFDRAGELARRCSLVASRRFGKESAQYAAACINLAKFHSTNREPQKAEPLLREAVTIRQKLSGAMSIEYAVALARLAEASNGRGDAILAEPLYRRALSVYETRFGVESLPTSTIWLELGRLNLARGELKEAQDNLRRAADLRLKLRGEQSSEYGQCLMPLGDAAMQRGDVNAAVACYREVLHRNERNAERMAALQTEEQQLDTAATFRGSLDQYLSLGDAVSAEDVYAHVLTWKGTVLDRQRRLRALRADPKKAQAFREWERLTAELVGLALRPPYVEDRDLWADRIRELAADRAAAERNLIGGEFQRTAPVKPAEVARALAPNSALVDVVEYVHRTPMKGKPGQWQVERRLAAFVVLQSETVKRVDLGPADDVTKLIDAWLKLNDPVAQRDSKAKPAADVKTELALHGRRLRALAWDPMTPHLNNAKQVLVSPDGALARFPLAALPGRAADSFLIEEVALAVVPVPALLAKPKSNSAPGGLFAVGDVDFGGPPGAPAAGRESSDTRAIGSVFWSRLPASGPDADNVRNFFLKSFPDQPATVLKRKDATEAAFRAHAPKSRWLHLSTHGFYAADMGDKIMAGVPKARVPGETAKESRVVSLPAGLLSGITFAGANTPNAADQDDGLLFALEAGALDLSSVELAVLSACDTAVGRLAAGEGVLGLQRTFHAAGAHGVIAALWPASDLGSMLLMGRFYINLWEKKLSKPEALREAQRWMIDAARKGAKEKVPKALGPDSDVLPARFASPDIWAAFILSGDGR